MYKSSHTVAIAFLAYIFTCAGIVAAQESEAETSADPAAMKAFMQLLESYRKLPALTVKSTIKIEISGEDSAAEGKEITGEFTFGQHRKAVIKLHQFTCYLNHEEGKPETGTITVVHADNPDAYFSSSDDGSPYYALFHALKDMPFPELALMLGEDSVDDVLLQFHPKAINGVVPTAIKSEEKDGKKLQRMTLTGENETIEMWIDPSTKLIQSMNVTLVGGAIAQPDVAVTYKHSYEYTTHDKPLPESTFAFDAGQRQKVDTVLTVLPKPQQPDGADEDFEDGDGPASHQLTGKKAPGFVLATSDGKAVDLDELRGRVVVLDFWASWCGPCLAGLPKLHEVAKWASAEQLPVSIYTVNVFEVRQNDSPDARLKSARATWEKRNFTLPVLMDYTDETASAYCVRGIPATFIIRADGIVHQVHVGLSENFMEELKREIQDAISAVEQ